MKGFVSYRVALGILSGDSSARLILIFDRRRGDQFHLHPGGHQIRPDIARDLIQRDLVMADPGLFPDLPQSWMHRCHDRAVAGGGHA